MDSYHASITAPATFIASSRQRPIIILLALVFCIGFLTLPAEVYIGDANTWREEGRSLVLHGSLAVDPALVPFSHDSPGEHLFFVYNPRDGQWYSRYGILNGLLSAIPLAFEKIFTGDLPPLYSPKRPLFLGIFYLLVSLAIAAVLYRIAQHYCDSAFCCAAFVIVSFFCTYLWNYLRCTSSESTQLLLFALSYLYFLRYLRASVALKERPLQPLYTAWFFLLLFCLAKVPKAFSNNRLNNYIRCAMHRAWRKLRCYYRRNLRGYGLI